MKLISILVAALFSGSLWAESQPGDYLVKFSPAAKANGLQFLQSQSFSEAGGAQSKVEDLDVDGWVHVQVPAGQISTFNAQALNRLPGVLIVQPNYTIKLLENYQIKSQAKRDLFLKKILDGG